MLHQTDFHDYPYCPTPGCGFDLSVEVVDIDKEVECSNCGQTVWPRIRSAQDQYEDYGDMKYHELKDEGLT